MGIEPTSSAWKAEVLPLNYTRRPVGSANGRETRLVWWWGQDSNLRRLSRQIYSLLPLTAWVPHPGSAPFFTKRDRLSTPTPHPGHTKRAHCV